MCFAQPWGSCIYHAGAQLVALHPFFSSQTLPSLRPLFTTGSWHFPRHSVLPKMRGKPQVNSLLCTLLLLLLLLQYAQGIEVTADSGCSELCVDDKGVRANYSDPRDSTTNPPDMVCEDSQFSDRWQGRKWTECLRCQASSNAASPGLEDNTESDVLFFLCKLCAHPLVKVTLFLMGYFSQFALQFSLLHIRSERRRRHT